MNNLYENYSYKLRGNQELAQLVPLRREKSTTCPDLSGETPYNFISSSHYPIPPSQPPPKRGRLSPTGEEVAKHFPFGGK